jgi:hypothetical protein
LLLALYVFAGIPAAAAFLAGTSILAFPGFLAVVGMSAQRVHFVSVVAGITKMFL